MHCGICILQLTTSREASLCNSRKMQTNVPRYNCATSQACCGLRPVIRVPTAAYNCVIQRCYALNDAQAAAADGQPMVDAEEQQQQQTLSIPMPLGSTEPPEEQPKKLSPHARLSEELASTSITIIGDDTDLNWAVCQALSKKIGWFPVSTARVLMGLHKADSMQEMLDNLGQEAVAQAEAGVLKGMRDQLRCCVATIGNAAAADAKLYSNLYGTIIIWLDEQDKRSPKPSTPPRHVFQQQAEVTAVLQKTTGGFAEKGLSLEEKAQKATGQLIKAMNQLLKDHSYLPAKKRLYVEYGCRGDWPELQPQEWNPVLEGLDRSSVAS